MTFAANGFHVTPIDHGPESLCHFGVEVRGLKVGELNGECALAKYGVRADRSGEFRVG